MLSAGGSSCFLFVFRFALWCHSTALLLHLTAFCTVLFNRIGRIWCKARTDGSIWIVSLCNEFNGIRAPIWSYRNTRHPPYAHIYTRPNHTTKSKRLTARRIACHAFRLHVIIEYWIGNNAFLGMRQMECVIGNCESEICVSETCVLSGVMQR